MLVWTRRVIKGFFEEMKPELDLEQRALEAGGLDWEKVHEWEYARMRLLAFWNSRTFGLIW